jgi:hypothetical protein
LWCGEKSEATAVIARSLLWVYNAAKEGLMSIIRVFPRRTSLTPTDELAFVGDPPLFRPEADEVHVSCTFTWDVSEARRLVAAWHQHYPVVKLGGPALDSKPNGFTPGLYVAAGVTFTSRGCNNNCPWCLVPKREGRLREYEDIKDGWTINDNNFLQCSSSHRQKVYAMLWRQKRAAVFSGGIDARLVDDEIAAEFRSIRIKEIFLAADTEASLRVLDRAVNKLHYLGRHKLRCYVLCGFNGESIEQAETRLEACWQIGVMPFAQLYQPAGGWVEYSKEWKQLARKWSRPAAMVAAHQETLPSPCLPLQKASLIA